MNNFRIVMQAPKRFRQGQILKLVAGEPIANQHELRRRLAHLKLRVTQATLSRDLRELKLLKTPDGYKPVSAVAEESAPVHPLTHALKEFLLDIRPADNLLVLKTPPGGAQTLAAALDAEKFAEVAGTVAGDDTILIVTPKRKARETLQKKLEALVR